MRATKMYISMEGVKFYAFHGVDNQERKIGANFLVNLRIETDFRKAAISDSLADTISYADIFNDVKEEMNIPSKLLENVCHRIGQRLFNNYPSINSIKIKLTKENPPMNSDSRAIGVEMKLER